MEVMVSISILAIMSLGLGRSIVTALTNHKTVQVNSALNLLGVERLEEYAAINPQSMDNDSHDDTETGLTLSYLSNEITFTRVTNVTVGADASRTVDVTVTCSHPKFPKSLSFQAVYSRW